MFVASKDGTKIPLFISHLKGLKLDQNNICLLYGMSKPCLFKTSELLFLNAGRQDALLRRRIIALIWNPFLAALVLVNAPNCEAAFDAMRVSVSHRAYVDNNAV